MTASKQIKGLLAGVAAVAVIGTAIAQGNPPNPAVRSAPVGAGQQSSQQTPMGTTGTPTGSGATDTGSSTGSTSTNMGSTSTPPTPSGSSSMGSSSMGSSSTSADTSGTTRPMRTARADRN